MLMHFCGCFLENRSPVSQPSRGGYFRSLLTHVGSPDYQGPRFSYRDELGHDAALLPREVLQGFLIWRLIQPWEEMGRDPDLLGCDLRTTLGMQIAGGALEGGTHLLCLVSRDDVLLGRVVSEVFLSSPPVPSSQVQEMVPVGVIQDHGLSRRRSFYLV